MPTITNIRHAQQCRPYFEIDRKQGYPEYSFVRFTDGIGTRIDGRPVTLPPHSCIIWRPGTPQFFCSSVTIVHDWFHFTGVDEQYFRQLGLPLDQWLHPRKWLFIADIMQEMQDEFYSRKPQKEELLQLKMNELFIKLSRTLAGESSDPVSESLRRLRTKMLSSPEQPWTVASLAEELSLSVSHFHALYRAQYGSSPIEDLIFARIEAAKYELINTDRAVGEIAESLGYSNVTHFSRQFKAVAGTAPAAFRLQYTNDF